MQREIQHKLTQEDMHLIEVNQLGNPLNVYKIRSGVIYFLFGFGYFIFVTGIISAAILILMYFIKMPPKQLIGNFLFISLFFQTVFCLLFGWLISWFAVPQYRKKHLVICEQGFFQVENTGLSKNIEIIHWQDIQSIKKSIFGYIVSYRRRERCSLDILYKNIGELAELIRGNFSSEKEIP